MDAALFTAAKNAKTHSYSPYSKFKVGAAVKSVGGSIYTGCNVENAAYPAGICAEVNAISNMVGHGEQTIAAIAICGDGGNLCAPCGTCRQFISEFSNVHTHVYVFVPGGRFERYKISELLPHAFNL